MSFIFDEFALARDRATFLDSVSMQPLSGTPDVDFCLAQYRDGAFLQEHAGGMMLARASWREIVMIDPAVTLNAFPEVIRKHVTRNIFSVTTDLRFGEVAAYCAAPRKDQPSAHWLRGGFLQLLDDLHASGHAHSFEAWRDGDLAAGSIGIQIGGVYFPLSAFTKRTKYFSGAGHALKIEKFSRLARAGILIDPIYPSFNSRVSGGQMIPETQAHSLRQRVLVKHLAFPVEPAILPAHPAHPSRQGPKPHGRPFAF